MELTSTFEGHGSWVRTSLYYPEYKRFVTCGDDRRIIIWSRETKKTLRVIDGSTCVNHLIKWDGDEFLSCSLDGIVRVNNVKKMKLCGIIYERRLEKGMFRKSAIQMIRISDDEFVLGFESFLAVEIISFSRKCLVRKLAVMSLFEGSKFLLSLIAPSCLFVSCGGDNSIYMLDYKKNEVRKEFKGTFNSYVYTFCGYLNRNKEEILVAGGNDKILYFFNTSLPEDSSLVKKVGGFSDSEKIRSSLVYADRFLFIGDYNGNLRYFDLGEIFSDGIDSANISKCEPVVIKSIHNAAVYYLHDFETVQEKKKNILKLSTCSYDTYFKIVEICDERIEHHKTGLEEEDLEERVGFLRNALLDDEAGWIVGTQIMKISSRSNEFQTCIFKLLFE